MDRRISPRNDDFWEFYELKIRFEKDEVKFKRYLELKEKFEKKTKVSSRCN